MNVEYSFERGLGWVFSNSDLGIKKGQKKGKEIKFVEYGDVGWFMKLFVSFIHTYFFFSVFHVTNIALESKNVIKFLLSENK